LLLKRISLVLIIFGGSFGWLWGRKAWKNPYWDVLPWFVNGFIVTISGALFAQSNDRRGAKC